MARKDQSDRTAGSSSYLIQRYISEKLVKNDNSKRLLKILISQYLQWAFFHKNSINMVL